MKQLLGVFFLFLLLPSRLMAAPLLNETEKTIQHYVKTNQTEALTLLEKIVNINSGTTNIAGVYRVGKILQDEFNQLGFKTYWVDTPTQMKRAGTLFAVHQGHHGKRILLIGHLDTVFATNSPFQKFSLHHHIAYGPGVIDDKGGDVVILYALKALQSVDALKDATIIVALTGDEEDSAKPTAISRRPLKEIAKQCDVALDFECSLGLDTATIARRGVSQYQIITRAAASHSAQVFHEGGDGAIFEMARILNSIRSGLSKEKHLATNPGILLGGSKVEHQKNSSSGSAFGKKNMIARITTVESDLRFISSVQQKKAEGKIRKIVNKHLPGTSATVEFIDGIPAMPPTAKNLKILRAYSQASVDLGHSKVSALSADARGAGDISFVASIVPANLGGLGPLSAGDGAHSLHEGLDIRSLSIASERAAILIYRLIR